VGADDAAMSLNVIGPPLDRATYAETGNAFSASTVFTAVVTKT